MKLMSKEAIAAQWSRIGGGLTGEPARQAAPLERLIAQSATYASQDQRILSVAAAWIGTHHALINSRKMTAELALLQGKDSAVAGLVFDLASQIDASDRLCALAQNCQPQVPPGPLFASDAGNAKLQDLARVSALPVYLKWGLWYHEVTLKTSAIRPIGWILKSCPDLRLRALLGPGLEAEAAEILMTGEKPVIEVAREAGSSYGATHEAIKRMLERGLVERADGKKKRFTLSSLMRNALAQPDPTPGARAQKH